MTQTVQFRNISPLSAVLYHIHSINATIINIPVGASIVNARHVTMYSRNSYGVSRNKQYRPMASTFLLISLFRLFAVIAS